MEMRAFQSQVTFSCFFSILMGTIANWTFINVHFRKTFTKPRNLFFTYFILLLLYNFIIRKGYLQPSLSVINYLFFILALYNTYAKKIPKKFLAKRSNILYIEFFTL